MVCHCSDSSLQWPLYNNAISAWLHQHSCWKQLSLYTILILFAGLVSHPACPMVRSAYLWPTWSSQTAVMVHYAGIVCRSGQSPGLPYGEKCLFVANDWHAALVPSFLAAKYRRNGVYTEARSIVAIHNMSHQGVEPSSFFGRLGLPGDW